MLKHLLYTLTAFSLFVGGLNLIPNVPGESVAEARPTNPNYGKSYVQVYLVSISPKNIKQHTDLGKYGPYSFSTAASIRDSLNGYPAWRSGGWRYYYSASVK